MRCIAAFAVALLAASPAAANWQYTEWGMSLEEVLAIEGVERTDAETAAPFRGFEILASAPYRADFISTEAFFVFQDGELARVDLIIHVDDDRETLFTLEETYGAPPIVEDLDYCFLKRRAWRDRANGNLVDYRRTGCDAESHIMVSYSPLGDAGAGGF